MSKQSMTVAISGIPCGLLTQHENGRLEFSYHDSYMGTPISLSMPLSNRSYDDKTVRPYLFGLLPDNPAVRLNTGKSFGVSGNNPFTLLRHIGLDCPGAIQFYPKDIDSKALSRGGSLEPINDHLIAKRLKLARNSQEAAWIDHAETWSLGGQQSKFALRNKNGAWYRCLGSEATTHIFKTGVGHLRLQALNEHICLRLASQCGIPAAGTLYRTFEDEPAVIIERYDRVETAAGEVTRLHQEDFCQILGVLPENKYPETGGPSTKDLIKVLKRSGESAPDNLELFTFMLFFNYLIGAPDGHAKNYSMLLDAAPQPLLAPLYDVASMLPYSRPKENMRTAMNIGGENRLGRIGRRHIERYAQSHGLADFGIDEHTCIGIMAILAESIPRKLSEVFDEAADNSIPGTKELRERMQNPIAKLCESTLEKL